MQPQSLRCLGSNSYSLVKNQAMPKLSSSLVEPYKTSLLTWMPSMITSLSSTPRWMLLPSDARLESGNQNFFSITTQTGTLLSTSSWG